MRSQRSAVRGGGDTSSGLCNRIDSLGGDKSETYNHPILTLWDGTTAPKLRKLPEDRGGISVWSRPFGRSPWCHESDSSIPALRGKRRSTQVSGSGANES